MDLIFFSKRISSFEKKHLFLQVCQLAYKINEAVLHGHASWSWTCYYIQRDNVSDLPVEYASDWNTYVKDVTSNYPRT